MSILNELFDENMNTKQLNELTQPYGRTASAINRAKSSVKGLVGGGQYEQGAEQSGQLANKYFMSFKRYIGTKYGTKPKYVTYNDVSDFMKSNKLDPKALGSNTNMSYTPKEVAEVFLSAAQEQVSSGLVPPSMQNPPQQGSGQGQPAPGAAPQTPPQSTPGQNPPQPAPQGGNSNPPSNAPATPPSTAPASAPQGGLGGKLASLTPAQRTKLLNILSKL